MLIPGSIRKYTIAVALLSLTRAVRVDEEEHDGPTNETGSSMLKWAVQNKVKGAEDLYFKMFSKGPDKFPVRGLASKQSYKKDDEVLRIPGDVLIYSESQSLMTKLSKLPGVPSQLQKPNCSGSVLMQDGDCSRLRLTTALLVNQAAPNDEYWAPYVKNLPSWDDLWKYHPAAGEESMLKSFEKLPIVQKLRDIQLKINRRFSVYKRLGGDASEPQFKWASFVVHSYCWGANGADWLAPVGDSFNTAIPEQQNLVEKREGTEKSNGDWDGSFVFTATKDIPAGAELLDNYQKSLSDDKFTASWGFPLRGVKEDPLPADDCKELLKAVGPSLKTLDGKCTPPTDQPQSVAFCSLSRLVLEHCSPEDDKSNAKEGKEEKKEKDEKKKTDEKKEKDEKKEEKNETK
eukprot:TRINITY_DN25406_c0_g1_i1.p1 TRINITY_DN25406_c0_g1~~TRINITY_DN25406_c0_g1_i1.p1  ORF type:complete len:403 (-),score=90.63 TRINITY_DN25406_c0_g1_i1:176-1384(-)